MSENGNRKCLVLAVPRSQGRNASDTLDVLRSRIDRLAMPFRISGRMKGSVDQHGRRNVAETLDGIAPTTVFILTRSQPLQAVIDQLVEV